MRQSKKRITDAVAASGTTLTCLFGVGPIVAAMVIGYTRDVARFTSRDAMPPTPAPHPSRSHRGHARCTDWRAAGTVNSTTPSTSWPSPRSASVTPMAAPSTTASSPKARPQGSTAGAQAAHQRRALPPAPARRTTRRVNPPGPGRANRERLQGQRDRLSPQTPALGEATPGPDITLRQPTRPTRREHQSRPLRTGRRRS